MNLQQQLEQGIRSLDIRLKIDGSGDGRFQFTHDKYLTNLSFLEGVEQINSFLNETSREIIILDFHRFIGTWSDTDFQDLARLIEQKFNNGRIIPASQQNNELGKILNTPGRVVVGMGEYSGGLPSNMLAWLRQNTGFWTNAVEQYWCGKSITTWSYVSDYMNKVLENVTVPKTHLWALMAQYNYKSSALPADAPVQISQYFAGDHGLRSNIVDTDWWNRVNESLVQEETHIPNFSTLINAVPLNIIKGYRKVQNQPLF